MKMSSAAFLVALQVIINSSMKQTILKYILTRFYVAEWAPVNELNMKINNAILCVLLVTFLYLVLNFFNDRKRYIIGLLENRTKVIS